MKNRKVELSYKKHINVFRKDVIRKIKENKTSLNQLSKETNISRSSLSRLKRKITTPTLRTYLILTDYFDLNY